MTRQENVRLLVAKYFRTFYFSCVSVRGLPPPRAVDAIRGRALVSSFLGLGVPMLLYKDLVMQGYPREVCEDE